MFATRLTNLLATRGKLCVGIDPHPSVLAHWGQPPSPAGIEAFARGLLEAIGQQVAVFKPQSAFFEAYGSAGIAVLERVLADIVSVQALSILDVKRGDIGSTMGGYANAYLADGSPLAADAITVSPYLGFGSLQPAIDAAIASDRGIYVLARTSNPEGGQVQLATDAGGVNVAQQIVTAAQETNHATGTNAIGLVVGGTHQDVGVDLAGFTGSILVPGIGAQGGKISDLVGALGPAIGNALPSVSREVLNLGPDSSRLTEKIAELQAGSA